MDPRHWRVLAALAALVPLMAGVARADTDGDEAARRHAQDAEVAASAGDYATAVTHLRDAVRASSRPLLRFNLAYYLAELGRNAEAFEEYARFVEVADRDGPQRAAAQAELARLRPLIGAITVTSKIAGIDVRIDGVRREPSRHGFLVEPGVHVVTIAAAGFEVHERRVEVPKGASIVVAPILIPRPPAASAGDRPAAVAVAPARWSVRVGAGAAGVGLVAIGLGLWTRAHYQELRSSCAVDAEGCSPEQVRGLERRELATNLTFGVAGVGVLTAGVLYVLERRRPRGATARLSLPPHPGVAVAVRF